MRSQVAFHSRYRCQVREDQLDAFGITVRAVMRPVSHPRDQSLETLSGNRVDPLLELLTDSRQRSGDQALLLEALQLRVDLAVRRRPEPPQPEAELASEVIPRR